MDADVIVVGAGLAGLQCARTLARAGLRAIVIEAGADVGGRVTTDRIDGFRCDRGFQVLNPGYPAVRTDVDVAALELQPFDAGVLVRTDRSLATLADPFRATRLLGRTAFAAATSGLLSPRELVGLARWLVPALRDPQRSLDDPDLRVSEALDRAGVRGPLGQQVLLRFLSGVVVDSHGDTSANYVRLLLRSFGIGRPGLPRGGMISFPRLLAREVDELRLGQKVIAIEGGAGDTVVRTDDSVVRARAVIVATDPGQAHSLLGIDVPAGNGLVTWWFDAPDAPSSQALVAIDGRGRERPPGPVWNTAVVSNAAPDYAPPGRHLISATTLLDRSDGEAGETAVLRHLTEIWGTPTHDWRTVLRHHIPYAVPASPPPLHVTSPVRLGDGRYVCGDHRDTASIQGALVSGRRAADAVAADLAR